MVDETATYDQIGKAAIIASGIMETGIAETMASGGIGCGAGLNCDWQTTIGGNSHHGR